jgi:hypothetical protein
MDVQDCIVTQAHQPQRSWRQHHLDALLTLPCHPAYQAPPVPRMTTTPWTTTTPEVTTAPTNTTTLSSSTIIDNGKNEYIPVRPCYSGRGGTALRALHASSSKKKKGCAWLNVLLSPSTLFFLLSMTLLHAFLLICFVWLLKDGTFNLREELMLWLIPILTDLLISYSRFTPLIRSFCYAYLLFHLWHMPTMTDSPYAQRR